MNTPTTTYAIRVDGHLDDHWSARLGEADMTLDEDGTTTLAVSIADQAQLHGVLAGLRDIGAVITELRSTAPTGPARRPVPSRASALWDDRAVIKPEPHDGALRGTVTYPVRTARLLLRPLSEDDVEDVLAYRGRADVCRWVPFEPMSRSEVLDRIHSSRGQLTDEGQALTAGVELDAASPPEAVADGQRGIVIGDVVLMWHSREHCTGEIGYVFHPDYSGQGFATEAVRALLDIAFGICGLHRVIARIDARNLASMRLAERLGMRREAHLVENEWFKGAWSDEIDYAMLEREWLSKRK